MNKTNLILLVIFILIVASTMLVILKPDREFNPKTQICVQDCWNSNAAKECWEGDEGTISYNPRHCLEWRDKTIYDLNCGELDHNIDCVGKLFCKNTFTILGFSKYDKADYILMMLKNGCFG